MTKKEKSRIILFPQQRIFPKEIIYLFLSLFFSFNIVSNSYAKTYDFEVDGLGFTVNRDKKTACIQWGGTYLQELIIPDSVSGSYWDYDLQSEITGTFAVTEIAEAAFTRCLEVAKLSIPYTIKYIGQYAFYNCPINTLFYDCPDISESGFKELKIATLKKVEFGPHINTISNFGGLQNLETVIFSNSVTSIEANAFKGDWRLKTIIIPDCVESIGKDAFYNCTSLTSVSISNRLKTIPDGCFWNCKSIESIEIPVSVKSIGSSAFEGCTNLLSVLIPNTVTDIGSCSFRGCSKLESVKLPNSIQKISACSFENCTSLMSISIPSFVNIVEGRAFKGCTLLSNVVFSNHLEGIEDSSFENCTSLVDISFPSSLKYIGTCAFRGCFNLKNIFCYAKNPPLCEYLYAFEFNKEEKYDAILFVPDESIEKYKVQKIWCKFYVSSLMGLTPGHNFDTYWKVDVDAIGVTADGQSELDVSQFVYEPFTKTVPDFEKVKVTFEFDGVECNDEKIIGKIGKVGWIDTNSWGFTYTAPEDFPESIKGNDYTLDVTVTSEENGLVALLGGTQIKVYRPGVMLVHGLLSDLNCFIKMKKYLHKDGGYEDFQLLNLNYSNSNIATFQNNTKKNNVIYNGAIKLHQQLADAGIVSSSYDIVGHSMGGLLARKYAQEVDQKSVNRIITINTPHSGSPLADTFEKIDMFLTAASLAGIMKILPMVEKCWKYFEILKNNWGGISDLSPSSEAIKNLNSPAMLAKAQGIPVHAFCSTLDMGNTTSQENTIIDENTMNWYNKISLGYFFIKAKEEFATLDVDILRIVFGNEVHDGIVSFPSQRGGLDGMTWSLFKDDYKGIFGFSSPAHHCNVTKYPETLRIRNLLYSPKNSDNFAKGFHPVDLTKNSARMRTPDELAEFKSPSESQFIKILAEKEDTARVLKVTVSGSHDLWSNIVLIGLNDEQMMTGIGRSEYRFQIPDTYEGDIIVYAIGRTEDDALVGDTLTMHYDSNASLEYMYFEDWPNVTMVEGQQLELNVLAGWTNGEERYITPSYTTDKDGILEFDGSMVIAKGAGDCLLIANYGNLADTLSVKVVSTEPNSIKSITVDKPIIRYSNGNLTITSNKSISGNLAVEIYDLKGNAYFLRHQKLSINEGEQMTFNLSYLPPQMYIVKVTGLLSATLKLYKR